MLLKELAKKTNFRKLGHLVKFLKDIKIKKTPIEEERYEQEEFNEYIKQIRIGKTSEEQKCAV